MKKKVCDECGKPFPETTILPQKLKALFDKATTCTECLQRRLSQLSPTIDTEDNEEL